ncbi:hypothetical protein AGMMS49938_11730 [Fibrobacterales bacterium]|nr:hypothetical protein AGMMS49938_11730 [Fibrobacterales bacterium]
MRVNKQLYKSRGTIAAVLALVLLAFPPSPEISVLALPFFLSAFALRIWARMHIGNHTRAAELACPEIVKTGPYKYFKHPLYLSNALAASAFAFLHLGISPTAFAFIFTYAAFLTILAKKEENFIMRAGGWFAHSSTSPADRAHHSPPATPPVAKVSLLKEPLKTPIVNNNSTKDEFLEATANSRSIRDSAVRPCRLWNLYQPLMRLIEVPLTSLKSDFFTYLWQSLMIVAILVRKLL